MIDDPFELSPSLFDAYLIYFIIGLILFTAFIGLVILLTTSCCCFFCYVSSSSSSCCFSCFHRRHSSYRLNQSLENHRRSNHRKTIRKIAFLRRHSSDLTDFSQLYDSCPHLINSKAMATTETINAIMDHSAVILNRPVHSISSREISSTYNSLQHISPRPPPRPSIPRNEIRSKKDLSPTEFTPIDNSISSSFNSEVRTHSPCANIYESVVANANSARSTPIYECEWKDENPLSVLKLPLSPRRTSSKGFQTQQSNNRIATSNSKRLKDDTAFLY